MLAAAISHAIWSESIRRKHTLDELLNAGIGAPGVETCMHQISSRAWTVYNRCVTMTNQLASTTVWPPSGANAPGQDVQIKVSYPFPDHSCHLLGRRWRPLNDSGTFNLAASSTEPIKF